MILQLEQHLPQAMENSIFYIQWFKANTTSEKLLTEMRLFHKNSFQFKVFDMNIRDCFHNYHDCATLVHPKESRMSPMELFDAMSDKAMTRTEYDILLGKIFMLESI